MKKIVITLLLCCGSHCFAQHLFTTAYFGASNYQGDLQDKIISTIQSKAAWGVGLMYECNSRIYIDVDFRFAKISGDDRYNPSNRNRNLNFKSDIGELSASVEYNLFDLYDYKATPYFFVGIGIFKFSPYVEVDNGSIVYLADLNTEGQGFYKDRKKYKLTQWCIPFGGGFQFALSNKVRLALSLGLRKTSTDYLDDVSTTYVDKDLIRQNGGDNAVLYAYRGNQLPYGAPYPAEGTMRGNPNKKDWYTFLGATLKFRGVMHGRKRVDKKDKHRGSVNCPVL
jgi:hypothetical protein